MKFIVNGGKKIQGEIETMGSKNAALKIFPVALLTQGTIRVSNMPEIEDCLRAQEMFEALGHKIKKVGNKTFELTAQKTIQSDLPASFVNKFRASVMFVGPTLAVCGEVKFPHPGGCVIGAGTRPIDLFLDGFKKMGAKIEIFDDHYRLTAKKLIGAEIFFDKITVTGTESLMMTAVLAKGETILKNCAMEPEIVALAEYLNKCGAKIKGAGTPTIIIKGGKKIRGGEYKIMPDRIEAGTFAILAAASNTGDVLIKNCQPEYLGSLWSLFDKIGVDYSLSKNSILIRPTRKKLLSCDVITHEYPGFPTDLQSPLAVLMTQTKGSSLIHEIIYDRRLLYTDILSQMGANIVMADPHRVIINGLTKLRGKKVISPDLRAGIALLMAGMIAFGKTEIDNIYQIDRGYEKISERLNKLGADIKKI